MKINTKPKDQGFTIIEVMIVLAIAALILLIVLLAVPALQRNSKNTTIKNDVATVAGGISTYESDNNGTVPAYINGTGSVSIGVSSSDSNMEKVTVGGSTSIGTAVTGVPAVSAVPDGTIVPYYKVQCDPNNPGATPNASSRSVSLYYTIQTSGGPKLQCSAG